MVQPIDRNILLITNGYNPSDTSYVTDLQTAITQIGSDNGTLVIDGPIALTGNVTVPSNVFIKVSNKEAYIASNGYTLTINGPFEAGLWQVFSGFNSGDITFGSGSVKEVFPEWWDDGSGDSTSAVNAAIAAARTISGCGVVVLSKYYSVTSVNASSASADFTKTLTIRGNGVLSSGFTGTDSAKIVLDAIGTNWLTLEDFGIQGVGTTGLLLARSTTSQNCSRSQIKNIDINGSWSLAAHIAIAAESTTYIRPRFSNSNASANYTAFWTGQSNAISVSSDNGTLYTSSNTDNRMYSPEFYAPYNSAYVTVFNGAAGYTLYSPLIITGNATGGRLVTLQTGTGTGIFNGQPLAFIDPLFEGLEPTSFYLNGDVAGSNYFNNVIVDGGFFNIYTTGAYTMLSANAGNDTILNNWSVGGKLRFEDAVQPVFSAYAVLYSHIDLYNQTLAGTITISGFQTASMLKANTLNEAATSVDYHGESWGTAAPASGTFAKGHIRWNTDATSMQNLGLLGWQCVASGTPGTWVAIYRGLFSGVTGGRPTSAPIGFMYFDTTLGTPIWWNVSGWVDSAGTGA